MLAFLRAPWPVRGALLVSFVLLPCRLAAQGSRLHDSVTVAPGMRVPATHAGASRAIVDSNDVKTAAALTFSELMQARGASVNVMMSGGRLVDGGHFLIRGPSTLLTEGAPMLIVDGMRMAEREDDHSSTSSRLDDLAIDDIAKVEVLRGPSASALYGAGASAGVIIVTTKRGRAGRISGRVRAGSEMRQDAGNYADRYRRLSVGSTTSYSCTLASAAGHYCMPGAVERWNPLAEAGVFRNGFGGTASLDVDGGTNTRDVRLSATTRRANGISAGDRLSQFTTRLNVTQRVGTWLEATGRAAYYGNRTLASTLGEAIANSPYSGGVAPIDLFTKSAAFTLESPIDGRLDHATAGGEFTVRPAAWLAIRAAGSRDNVNEGAERIIRYPVTGSSALDQVAFTSTTRASNTTAHRALRASGELTMPVPASMHMDATLVAGTEHEWRILRQQYDQDLLHGTTRRDYYNAAAFALGRVVVADRLAINGGVRHEKDSGADRRWSAYPTGDASLVLPARIVGAEPRIRVAYGESAQRYGLTSELTIDDPSPSIYIGGFPQTPPRPLPERMKELEGGVDVDWGANAAIALSAYRRTVGNVIYVKPAPFNSVLVSALDLVSNGIEIDARAAIVQRESVRWQLRAIVATNSNRVTADSSNTGFASAGLITGFPVGVAQRRPYSFTDRNGDGVISFDETVTGTTTDRFGGSTPTLSMALHSELRLGQNIMLTAVVDRRSGAWTQSSYVQSLCRPPEMSCQPLQDPATSLSEQADALVNSYSSPFAPSFDASFTRLRELSLRWTLGSARASAQRGRDVRLVLSGRDLATWTQWPGLDPEVSSGARGWITRDDKSAVPLPRRFMVGVEWGT